MYSSHYGRLDPGLPDSLLRRSFFFQANNTCTDRIIFPSAIAQFHIKMMRNEMWFYINLPEVRNIGIIHCLNAKVGSV